jgi:hypothetical protein
MAAVAQYSTDFGGGSGWVREMFHDANRNDHVEAVGREWQILGQRNGATCAGALRRTFKGMNRRVNAELTLSRQRGEERSFSAANFEQAPVRQRCD